MKGFLLLFACLLESYQAQLFTDCPTEGLLPPCQCNNSDVNCVSIRSAEQLIKSLTTGFQDTAEFNMLAIEGRGSITYLPADVFRPIRAKVFRIRHNKLSYIDEDAFAGSEDFIKSMIVYNTNLQGVDIFVAMAKMKELQYVMLSANRLSSVPERAFAAMPELRYVDLSHNHITSLGREAFADCAKLQTIIINYNELRVLPGRILAYDGVPVGIGEIVNLELQVNEIEEIEPDAFEGIERPIEIDLSYNWLHTLPRGIFHRHLENVVSKRILLNGNSFVCDCRMRWVVENPDFFKILKHIVCSDTEKPLESYSLSEIGQCLP